MEKENEFGKICQPDMAFEKKKRALFNQFNSCESLCGTIFLSSKNQRVSNVSIRKQVQ